ncbi:ribonuclease Y [Spiroplasma monobiae]|uniref:Ribonuclease Y n=1 Tax=Spiroplasma monobiae MQ-1 TaxID=1336748 RepID=A0A2K9LTV4_SPISQ|nr:ribonuclease Y [Spiroplasma monobiae]AUM62502.1 ribonucrease Y [Spiroplasma monobiae MQ-1]
MLVTKSEETIYIAILAVLVLIVLLSIAAIIYLIKSRQRKYILQKANDEAKEIKMNILAQAKQEAASIKLNAENDAKYISEEVSLEQKNLKIKKEKFYKELDLLGEKEEVLINEKLRLKELKIELELERKNIQSILESKANLTEKEIKEELFNIVETKYLNELSNRVKEFENNLNKKAQERASKILIDAMQSCHIDITNEKNTTFFELENDSWKGRIIGKEGRNIKTFQSYGGVDIVIDETPNRIAISSFNPIRREIAYLTLQELMKSARIHPATIEEQLILQEEKLEKHCYEIGLETLSNLNIDDLPQEIVTLIGKLKYRHSYGQNALQHSAEVGIISGKIAQEMGLDQKTALKAGLLHDIGKAVDFEKEGSHVTLGVKILKKYGIDNIIINAVEAHHNEVEKETYYAEIVAIADAMSAARPGARNNDIEDYFARMQEIEDVCLKQEGVLKAYVLKSGREIRVMVNPGIIDDYSMAKLSYALKEKIEQVNKTPGDVYITIIREKRETIRI